MFKRYLLYALLAFGVVGCENVPSASRLAPIAPAEASVPEVIQEGEFYTFSHPVAGEYSVTVLEIDKSGWIYGDVYSEYFSGEIWINPLFVTHIRVHQENGM